MNNKITINGEEITIDKIPLGRYADLLDAIKTLPGDIVGDVMGFDKMKEAEVLGQLPRIFSVALPQFIKILSIATALDEEYIREKVGLTEAAKMVIMIFQVNDYITLKNVIGSAFESFRMNRAGSDKKEATAGTTPTAPAEDGSTK
jgi:hypothetical protein